MEGAWRELKSYGVSFDVRVLSAHRTAKALERYLREFIDGGGKMIIAGAGGAAHLAGVCASQTVLPVIGVPIPTSMMGGLDSLLSTVQMPGGMPVATVAAGRGGPKNAGILAVQMLALSDSGLAAKLTKRRKEMEEAVAEKDRNIQERLRET